MCMKDPVSGKERDIEGVKRERVERDRKRERGGGWRVSPCVLDSQVLTTNQPGGSINYIHIEITHRNKFPYPILFLISILLTITVVKVQCICYVRSSNSELCYIRSSNLELATRRRH